MPVRNRRPLPAEADRIEVHEVSYLDVLGGRGGDKYNHPGNEYYLIQIRIEQPGYKLLSPKQKTRLSEEVVQRIQDRGGRFLTRAERNGPWIVSSPHAAREKVSQALREDHTEEGRAAKKARRSPNSKLAAGTTPHFENLSARTVAAKVFPSNSGVLPDKAAPDNSKADPDNVFCEKATASVACPHDILASYQSGDVGTGASLGASLTDVVQDNRSGEQGQVQAMEKCQLWGRPFYQYGHVGTGASSTDVVQESQSVEQGHVQAMEETLFLNTHFLFDQLPFYLW